MSRCFRRVASTLLSPGVSNARNPTDDPHPLNPIHLEILVDRKGDDPVEGPLDLEAPQVVEDEGVPPRISARNQEASRLQILRTAAGAF